MLAAEAIALPSPGADWLTSTREAYYAYADSDVARLLRAEDVPQVVRLFGNLDRIARLEERLDADMAAGAPTRTLDDTIRAVRGLDAMVQKAYAALGIGPRERVNLGLLEAQGMKAAAEVEDELERALRG